MGWWGSGGVGLESEGEGENDLVRGSPNTYNVNPPSTAKAWMIKQEALNLEQSRIQTSVHEHMM